MFDCTCSKCGKTLDGFINCYGSKWVCSDCSLDKTDILHAEKGCKCKVVTLDAGWNSEKEIARKFLDINKEYTVEAIELGSYSSEVYLKEIPDISFNSVFFTRVQPPAKKVKVRRINSKIKGEF